MFFTFLRASFFLFLFFFTIPDETADVQCIGSQGTEQLLTAYLTGLSAYTAAGRRCSTVSTLIGAMFGTQQLLLLLSLELPSMHRNWRGRGAPLSGNQYRVIELTLSSMDPSLLILFFSILLVTAA